jgi:hypothetical protein
MAIMVSGDILYDFPSALLTKYAFGTSNLINNLPSLILEYIIWLGLNGAILIVYATVCISFDRRLGKTLCQYVFGIKSRRRY